MQKCDQFIFYFTFETLMNLHIDKNYMSKLALYMKNNNLTRIYYYVLKSVSNSENKNFKDNNLNSLSNIFIDEINLLHCNKLCYIGHFRTNLLQIKFKNNHYGLHLLKTLRSTYKDNKPSQFKKINKYKNLKKINKCIVEELYC